MILIILVLIIVFTVKVTIDLSFSGTKKVFIIENYNEIYSLDQLIKLPQFEGKILYINLYNVYCAASLKQFNPLRKIMERPQAEEIVYIHLATPKMTFTNFWKSTVKEQDLKGHHMLMNSVFYKEFWTHFSSEKVSYTPLYIAVGKDKKTKIISSPKTLLDRYILNDCNLVIATFVRDNLDVIRPHLLRDRDKLRISIALNKDASVDSVSCFSIAGKEKSSIKNRIEVWKQLDLKIKETFDAIAAEKINFKRSSIDLPMDVKELSAMIRLRSN